MFFLSSFSSSSVLENAHGTAQPGSAKASSDTQDLGGSSVERFALPATELSLSSAGSRFIATSRSGHFEGEDDEDEDEDKEHEHEHENKTTPVI